MKNNTRKIPGKGRPIRVNLSISTEYESKLRRLAISCNNMAPTTLAALLVNQCLDNPSIINSVQDRYNVHPEYRILPVREGGKLTYVVASQ